MSESEVSRVADLDLRGVDRLLPARVYWPGHLVRAPALVVHLGALADAAEICRDGYIELDVDAPVDEAERIIERAAVHGAELGACTPSLPPGGERSTLCAVPAKRTGRRSNCYPPSPQIQTAPKREGQSP